MTDFLFARATCFSGAARTLDLLGIFDDYNVCPDPATADWRAIRADWNTVGDDLLSAMTRPRLEGAHEEESPRAEHR